MLSVRAEHEDEFLKRSLIKAKLEAELAAINDEGRGLESELRANEQRCQELEGIHADYLHNGLVRRQPWHPLPHTRPDTCHDTRSCLTRSW